jgi:hypothetical protein
MTKSRGIGRGGKRKDAGRKPAGHVKIIPPIKWRPAPVEKGTPLAVLLAAMEGFVQAGDMASAAAIAARAAPYMHAKLRPVASDGARLVGSDADEWRKLLKS